MQLVFEKVEVVNLEADLRKIGLSIGDELNLQLDELGSCQAYSFVQQIKQSGWVPVLNELISRQ